jgi:hypothetical protein
MRAACDVGEKDGNDWIGGAHVECSDTRFDAYGEPANGDCNFRDAAAVSDPCGDDRARDPAPMASAARHEKLDAASTMTTAMLSIVSRK